MSLLIKIKRYSVFYFLASFCLSFPLHAKIFSKEQLQEIATSYIKEKINNPEVTINALPVDPRTPNRHCQSELELSTPNNPSFNRQVTIQIKCNDENHWNQYIHVRTVEMLPVVVAKSNLARGEIITKGSVVIEMMPSHFVRAQYLENTQPLIGSRSKRNIQSGMAILLNQICMVCKGDSVNIYASIRGLKIKTSGIALEDGTLGERVRVKNKKSGKVLNARVDGVESVQVSI